MQTQGQGCFDEHANDVNVHCDHQPSDLNPTWRIYAKKHWGGGTTPDSQLLLTSILWKVFFSFVTCVYMTESEIKGVWVNAAAGISQSRS